GARVWPAVAWLDQAQSRQAEIGHGARGRADIVAELRLDQNHDWPALDPGLGLVGPGPRHAGLLGAPVPRRRSPCPNRPLASSGSTVSSQSASGLNAWRLFYQRSADAIGRAPNSRPVGFPVGGLRAEYNSLWPRGRRLPPARQW